MKTNKRLVLTLLVLVTMLVSVFATMAVASAEASSGGAAVDSGLLTNSEINIRDPFIITYEGQYYMYGTEGENAFSGEQNRFLVYVGDDLETWDGPFTIYENDGSFWADKQYWAPAMFVRDGAFYFYGAMGGTSHETKGIFLFKAEDPLGPFAPVSDEPITKWEEDAIDAEIYEEDGKTYMIYTVGMEGIYCGELNDDLDAFVGETWKLFDVSGCGWAQSMFGDSMLNDGAAILKTDDGRLFCFFSTTGPNGYNMGYAESDNGKITGNWTCSDAQMLVGTSGGHNMFFTNLDGELMTAYHSPNFPGRPTFKYVKIAASGEIFFVD